MGKDEEEKKNDTDETPTPETAAPPPPFVFNLQAVAPVMAYDPANFGEASKGMGLVPEVDSSMTDSSLGDMSEEWGIASYEARKRTNMDDSEEKAVPLED